MNGNTPPSANRRTAVGFGVLALGGGIYFSLRLVLGDGWLWFLIAAPIWFAIWVCVVVWWRRGVSV